MLSEGKTTRFTLHFSRVEHLRWGRFSRMETTRCEAVSSY